MRVGLKPGRARKERLERLCAGIRAAGDEPVHYWDGTGEAAVASNWGDALELYRVGYRHVLVCECGYLGNRNYWSSLSWDGLNGRGLHAYAPARAELEELELMPWRGERPGYALLLGQVPDDWAVRLALGSTPYDVWLQEAELRLEQLGYEVRYRQHPEVSMRDRALTKQPPPLLQELEGARIAATLNSTSAIEAVCSGVPTLVWDHDGSMAAAVAADPECPYYEPPNRRAWVNTLARMQWSPDELSDGSAWRTLRQLRF